MAEGFALDEYVTPRCGLPKTIRASTVPKAAQDVGGLFSEVQKTAKLPGPEHYNKDFLSLPFSRKAKGGKFSSLAREWGKNTQKVPAVGQYESFSWQTDAKTRGGTMSKSSRGCYMFDVAVKHGKAVPEPGKYDGIMPGQDVKCLGFNRTRTDSRNPTKVSPVGPGFYQLDYKHVEPSSVSYSATREPGKSFIDRHVKNVAKNPAPGHAGIPESKVEDRSGRAKHGLRLLRDRLLHPRVRPGTTA